MTELDGIGRSDLPALRALAKHPLAHIGRALDEFNGVVLAANQEANDPNIDESDFAQIQDCMAAAITQYRFNANDKVRLKAAAQPQSSHISNAVFFDPQHYCAHLLARTTA
jgi:hypothetical protein